VVLCWRFRRPPCRRCLAVGGGGPHRGVALSRNPSPVTRQAAQGGSLWHTHAAAGSTPGTPGTLACTASTLTLVCLLVCCLKKARPKQEHCDGGLMESDEMRVCKNVASAEGYSGNMKTWCWWAVQAHTTGRPELQDITFAFTQRARTRERITCDGKAQSGGVLLPTAPGSLLVKVFRGARHVLFAVHGPRQVVARQVEAHGMAHPVGRRICLPEARDGAGAGSGTAQPGGRPPAISPRVSPSAASCAICHHRSGNFALHEPNAAAQ